MESCVIVQVQKKELSGEESCCSTIGWGRNEQGKDFAGDALFLFNKNWNWNSSKTFLCCLTLRRFHVDDVLCWYESRPHTRHTTFFQFCTRTGCSLVYRIHWNWNEIEQIREHSLYWLMKVASELNVHSNKQHERKEKRLSSGWAVHQNLVFQMCCRGMLVIL